MKNSIQVKLQALCILLVLLTATGISGTYYWLTKKDKHRESQQRIRIAFDITLDDLAERRQTATAKWKDVLTRDTTFAMTPSLFSQDASKLTSASIISAFLVSFAAKLKELGQNFSADRVAVYTADKRLLAFYLHDGGPERTGGYVLSATGQDTYLAMDDPAKASMFLVVERGQIPDVPLPAGLPAAYAGNIPETVTAALFQDGQKLGLRIVAPLSQDKTPAGVLICDIGYTQAMLKRYADLSKTDINFFAGPQWSIGTLPAQKQLEPDALPRLTACQELSAGQGAVAISPFTLAGQDYYQGRCALQNEQETMGAITVSLSQEFEQREIDKIIVTVLVVAGIALVAAIGLSLLFSRKTIGDIHDIVNVIAVAAAGDLRRLTTVRTRDELGLLAQKLNQMIAQLRTISGNVQHASDGVHGTADTILRQMTVLIHHMEQQAASVDYASTAVEQVNHFIDRVAQNSKELLTASADIFAAIQETRASVEEVANSTGQLTTNLYLISSSVDQVNHSVKRVSENTGHLAAIAQQTETEMQRIGRLFQEVSQNAAQTQQLAQETMNAATEGQVSVDASLQGMAELKAVAANTAQIIREVNSWGEQVSSILNIVDEITAQTSLLALNASIISAQAGAHGRGFAVVAGEIKELATRTKTSTKEIDTLVRKLQMKTEEGVKHTEEGIEKAEQGMRLAYAVKAALNTILARATDSSNRAADTAAAMQQTTASSQQINTLMTRVTEMVASIKQAQQTQEQDIEQVFQAVENLSGMSEEVNRSTLEQNKAAEQIMTGMGRVTSQFEDISTQTTELKRNSEQMVAAMHTIESTTTEILQNAGEISGETVKNLVAQSTLLQNIVQIFKVS